MDLKQAYGLLRKEKLSLQNEVRKLNKTIDQISSGSYEDPLKIKHLKQIRDLTWKNRFSVVRFAFAIKTDSIRTHGSQGVRSTFYSTSRRFKMLI